MKVTIKKRVRPSTPWNVTIAKLRKLEETVVEGDRKALEARWRFGRELAGRRVEYKGKQVIPKDLMDLTIATCNVSRAEVNKRVRFAERYPTKELMCNAITHYPSWYKMTQEGLVEKKKQSNKVPKPTLVHTNKWVIGRLVKELEQAFAHHGTLSRDQVRDLEQLEIQVRAILEQIDRNDQARAS